MKYLLLLCIAIFSFQCTKKNTPAHANEELPIDKTAMVSANGSFKSNVHPTTGKVSVITNDAGKKLLYFENFKTDNGPDLRVYLSPNTSTTSFVEIGSLKAVSGNFFYELKASANYTTNNHVLIWCEDFSVLFGHAVLGGE